MCCDNKIKVASPLCCPSRAYSLSNLKYPILYLLLLLSQEGDLLSRSLLKIYYYMCPSIKFALLLPSRGCPKGGAFKGP